MLFKAVARATLFIMAFVLVPLPAPAGEDEEALDEEIGELSEDDFPDLVGADESSELMDEFELLEEDIVYSAALHKQVITESPSAISVLTREQIQNTHCTDVICLFRHLPEVDVRRMVPMFVATGARALSGESADKMVVFVDGREITHEVFGMTYWQALPVHMEEIDRIEVIRGPGSALYGANAHSMVVSITTRSMGDRTAEVFVGGGEHDRTSLHARLGRRIGNLDLQLSGGLDTASNWRIRDKHERESSRARLRITYESEDSVTSLQAGMASPVGMIFTTIAPGYSRDSYNLYLALAHRTDLFQTQLNFDFWDFTLTPDIPLFLGETKLGEFVADLHYLNTNLDASARVNLELFEGNLLIAGGNYRWIAMLSDLNDPDEVHQHRVGLFVHDEQRLWDQLVLTTGIRLDYNSITPFAVSPRLAGVWRFAPGQFLRLAFGRAFRKAHLLNTSFHFLGVQGAPGFDELETFFLNSVGNRNLENESVTAFEIGYRGQFLDKRLRLEVEAFFNLYRDTIAFHVEIATNSLGVPDLLRSSMEYRNAGREVNSAGGSISVSYQAFPELRLSANYTFRHSWYIADSDEVAVGEGGAGSRVPWERAHMFNLGVHYGPETGPRAGLSLHAASEADLALPENGMLFDDYKVVHNPPVVFAGAYLAWRLQLTEGTGSFVEMGVRGYNLFGRGFRDTPAVTRPDGVELGGELLGRRIFVFVRGSV